MNVPSTPGHSTMCLAARPWVCWAVRFGVVGVWLAVVMTEPSNPAPESAPSRSASLPLVLGVGAAVGLSIAALVVALNDDDPVCPAPAHAEENNLVF